VTGYRGTVDSVPIDSAPVGDTGGDDTGGGDGGGRAESDVPIDGTAGDGGGPVGDAYNDGSEAEPSTDDAPTDTPGFDRWRRRSVTGAVMTGIALGLQEVFIGPKPEIAIVHEAPGEPPAEDQAIALSFDPDHPHRTVAVIRPWLLDRGRETSASSEDAPDRPSPGAS